MAANSFPSCQARPKSSSRIESKCPSAAASSAIARFHVADQRPQRDLRLGAGFIWSAQQIFACLEKIHTRNPVSMHNSILGVSLGISALRADLWSTDRTIHLENDDS